MFFSTPMKEIGKIWMNGKLVPFKDEDLGSANIFMNKKNFKWYALLGIGIILWFAAERV